MKWNQRKLPSTHPTQAYLFFNRMKTDKFSRCSPPVLNIPLSFSPCGLTHLDLPWLQMATPAVWISSMGPFVSLYQIHWNNTLIYLMWYTLIPPFMMRQCFMLSHLKICHVYNITLHRSTIYWTKMIFFVVLLHPLSPTIVTINIKWHGHHHILHCLPWDALLGVAATFSCCLFVGLSASSFVLSAWKASSVVMRSGPWLGHWKMS